MPIPRVVKGADGRFTLSCDHEDSIGRLKAFFGNYLVIVRAYAYIREMGARGILDSAHMAVLNANYVRTRISGTYNVPYNRTCMHECVADDTTFKKYKVNNVDVAKGLIDRGFHPPTVSFPLNVHGALMIEPTESEAKEDLDRFVDALMDIAEVARTNPDELHLAPHNTHISRPDEASAARSLILTADMESLGS